MLPWFACLLVLPSWSCTAARPRRGLPSGAAARCEPSSLAARRAPVSHSIDGGQPKDEVVDPPDRLPRAVLGAGQDDDVDPPVRVVPQDAAGTGVDALLRPRAHLAAGAHVELQAVPVLHRRAVVPSVVDHLRAEERSRHRRAQQASRTQGGRERQQVLGGNLCPAVRGADRRVAEDVLPPGDEPPVGVAYRVPALRDVGRRDPALRIAAGPNTCSTTYSLSLIHI